MYQCHNSATYDGMLVPDKVKGHLLEVGLCAGHLVKWTETILVSSSMVVSHPPRHPWRRPHGPVGHVFSQILRQHLGAKVPHLVGVAIEGDRGEDRVASYRRLLVLATCLTTWVHHWS